MLGALHTFSHLITTVLCEVGVLATFLQRKKLCGVIQPPLPEQESRGWIGACSLLDTLLEELGVRGGVDGSAGGATHP